MYSLQMSCELNSAGWNRKLQVRGHTVVCEIGKREVAREKNLHAVAFADRDSRENV